jgi:RNA polymerase sigma-70 factor (ECF subfamily)
MNPVDDDEFVKLLTDHQAVIRAFIISLLPGAPGVDDVIQETNVVLWKKREDFTMGTNFRAWAITVARFQTMVHIRELKKRHWVTLDEDVTGLMADDIERIADAVTEERRVAVLLDCMAKLRSADHDLLMERYWSKTRLLDFAVITGRSLAALKVRLFRLRTILKRCIEENLTTEGAR